MERNGMWQVVGSSETEWEEWTRVETGKESVDMGRSMKEWYLF